MDAYLFRFAGTVLGFAGCAGLTLNNTAEDLFSSPYGVTFLLIFGVLGFYSVVSLIREALRSPDSSSGEAD